MEICCRLDGIPLAIELAVARLGVLTIHQITERLGDRLRLLTGGSRRALPRHQTLRALIDWSYDLLSEGEQTVLRRLGVFSGGFDLEAAEAVCHDDRADTTTVLDRLHALVSKSLVVMSDLHDRARYWMLETIRQHATEKLFESGEMTCMRGRHFDFFLDVAESEAQQRFRKDPVPLIRNRENLAAALAWRTSESPVPPSALRLAAALVVRYSDRFGFCQTIEPWLARALDARGNDNARACLLNGMGFYAGYEGRFDEARRMHTEALHLAARTGNLVEQARAMAGQARLAALGTAHDEAIALFDRAIELTRSADSPDLEAAFRTSRSELLLDDRARRQGFEEAFRIAREHRFPQIQQAGSRLVNDAIESGDCAAAARLTKMICTTLSEISDDGYSEMWSAEMALFAFGDLEAATEFIAAAEGRGLEAKGHLSALRAHIADRMGHDAEARTLWQRVAAHAQGRVPHFERYRLIKAAEWAMDHGESAWAARLIDQFGAHIAHSQSPLAAMQLDAVRARFYRTIRHPDADSAHRRVFERLRPGMDFDEACLILAVAYHAAFAGTDGPVADALDSLIDWGSHHANRLLMVKAVDARAEVEWTRGNVQAAARRHEQAIHIAEQSEIHAEKAGYIHDLGRVALASGDIATAARRANEALAAHRIYQTRGVSPQARL